MPHKPQNEEDHEDVTGPRPVGVVIFIQDGLIVLKALEREGGRQVCITTIHGHMDGEGAEG